MQGNGFICRSCRLLQLRATLAPRREPGRFASTSTPPTVPKQASKLPKKRTPLPAAALTLRSDRAPWATKRRVLKKIERELFPELPKPPKKSDNPEELKKYQFREYLSRAAFFRKYRHPKEVKEYNAWKEAFYALTRQWEVYASTQQRAEQPSPGASTAYYSEVCHQLAEFVALEDEGAIREKWLSRTWEDREESWPRLVLATLAFSPRSACGFLRATWNAVFCPIYVIHDAVWFLIRRPAAMQNDKAAQDLCDLVVFLLRHARQGEGAFQMRQWDIFQLLSNLSSDTAVHELYQELVSSGHALHRHTRLQFAKRFGESPVLKPAAFDILESLVQAKEMDVNSPHVAALCTTILTPSKKAIRESLVPGKFIEGTEMSEVTTRYSERMLQLGFNPNLITYSVLIRDLILRKDVQTALDVHKIMASQELKPDALLYSFLLNGAKTSHSWLPMHMLVQQAFLDEVRDPVVWNELLHTVFMAYLGEVRRQRGRRTPGMPAFHPMLKLYANIFKTDMLRMFIPADVDYLVNAELHVSNMWECERQVFLLAYRTPSWSSRGLLEPGYDTLTLMILGYINSLSNPQSILEFYLHFRQLLERGDPHATRLVQKGGTRIYDYVLRGLLQWREHLGTCVGLVSDMLKLSGQSPVQAEPLKSVAPLRPPHGAAAVVHAGPVPTADDLPLEKLSISPVSPAAELSEDAAALASGTARPHSGLGEPTEGFRHPAPTVHTWSILINGLMFHREADKAERVVELMQENGVEPSIVTHNTLIAGYANAQNVRKTVNSLQRLEGAGLEADDFTFKAWTYLADKEAALELMGGAQAEQTKRMLLLRQQAEEEQQAATAGPERLDPQTFRAEMDAWDEASASHGGDRGGDGDGDDFPGHYDRAVQYGGQWHS